MENSNKSTRKVAPAKAKKKTVLLKVVKPEEKSKKLYGAPGLPTRLRSEHSLQPLQCAKLRSKYEKMKNSEDGSRSRRVSYSQLEALCEFLNSHRGIAVGYNKSTLDRHYSRKKWQIVAQTLNSMGEGAIKNWKGWSTYWVDYKAKLKRKVNRIRQTGGEPSNEPSLTEVDRRFLQILGEEGASLPGVPIDPLENTEERAQQNGDSEPADFRQNQLEHSSTSSLDTDLLLVVASEEDQGSNSNEQGVGSDDDTDTGSHEVESSTGDSHTVKPRAGGSQRRRSRVPTAEIACALLESSEERVNIERTNSKLLGRLVDVLERMQETLCRIEASAFGRRAGASPTNTERDYDV